jgi:putative transcription factor
MKVCQDCSRFGKVKGKSNVRVIIQDNKKSVPQEPEYVFMQGYGSLVKNAREKQGLKQEDFAKKINEHKSMIHQVESEHIKPSIVFARKLERALHIKIVEEIKSNSSEDDGGRNSTKEQHPSGPGGRAIQKPKGEGLTLGDIMNRR